jgi:hypothetical protein
MARRKNILSELWGFIKENKAWWLVPILITIILLGALMLTANSPAGAFIYTIF